MIEDFYDEQTYDWYTIKGDTQFIKMEFFDINDMPINMSLFDIKFTIQDPVEDEPILSLQKDRTAGVPNGIFHFDDNTVNFGMGITTSNQIVIHLTPEETKLLDKEVYPFDVEFKISGLYDAIFTRRGHLIIDRDITPNV